MSMLPRHALRSASQAWRSANATRPLASFTNYRTLFIPPSPSCTQPLRWRSASFHRRLASSTSSFAPAADQKAPAPASEESVPKSAGSAEEGSPDDRFSTAASEELLQAPGSSPSQPIGKIERRLSITFTCTVPDCGHRSSHEFSRLAYERGIVLCQCPACLTRHLIADHLGWFDSDDLTQGGKYRTIEALLEAKGESVSRARILADGTLEIEDEGAEGEATEPAGQP